MFAVTSFSGKQYKADLGCSVVVDRIEAEVGQVLNFGKVLLVEKDGQFVPAKESSQLVVKVLEHFKGDKCTIFKKRRRKHYRRSRGFRPSYTKLLVQEIKL